ncbi:hypothetical protein ACFVDT_06950 [Streptomyces sp. NPDC057699]|uniref:hypothetical protein n=1 Tax=Streptomyces sp. NPDC057699 TaxID=3346220 RepID=UPI0036A05429
MARATRLQLAQAAYASYGEATGGLNVRGEPLPEWDDLGGVVQHAWLSAVQEVERLLRTPPADTATAEPDTD